MTERRGVNYKTVFIALGVSIALAAGVGLFIYFHYVRYERVAVIHLPAGTRAAARFDLEKVVLYEPFRSQLLPMVNEHDARARRKEDARIERFKHHTGIELGVDVREVVVGWGPGGSDWVVALGGLFRRGGVLDGLARVLEEEGKPFRRTPNALVAPSGEALGQAADGTLVAASSEALLGQALPATRVYESLGMTRVGPGSFGIAGSTLQGIVPTPLRFVAPSLAVVDDVERIHGELSLGQDVSVEGLVELRSGDDAADRVRSLLTSVRAAGALPAAGPLKTISGALGQLEVTPAGPRGARVTARWTRDEVEFAAARLADLLRVWFGWR